MPPGNGRLPTITRVQKPNYNLRHGPRPSKIKSPTLWPNILDARNKEFISLHQAYEKSLLRGFTLQQLIDTGAWPSPSIFPPNEKAEETKRASLKEVPIRMIYSLRNWLGSNEKIGHGYDGTWDINVNRKLAAVMVPCLKLASLMLAEAEKSIWFDALLFSPWRSIAPQDMHDDMPPQNPRYQAWQYSPRSPETIARDGNKQKNIERFMKRLNTKIKFQIGSRVQHIHGNPGMELTFVAGKTGKHAYVDEEGVTRSKGVLVTLSSEIVLPLLDKGLTESERLIQTVTVAKTVMHETMHAISMKRKSEGKYDGAEPFFADEEIAELGRSWEKSFFGGLVMSLHDRSNDNFHLPALAMQLKTPWPDWQMFKNGKYRRTGGSAMRYRYHDRFPAGSPSNAWPITIKWVENISQSTYWEVYVKQFGQEALRPPRLLGLRRTKRETEGSDDDWIYGPDYHTIIGPNGRPLPKTKIPENPTELEMWRAERRQEIRTNAIKLAQRRLHFAKRYIDKRERLRSKNQGEILKTASLEQQLAMLAVVDNMEEENKSDAFELCVGLAQSSEMEVSIKASLRLARESEFGNLELEERRGYCRTALEDVKIMGVVEPEEAKWRILRQQGEELIRELKLQPSAANLDV